MKHYTLIIPSGSRQLKLRLQANDTSHAQAQAEDVCKSLNANQYKLDYVDCRETYLSKLFNDLASNNFTHKECYEWEGPTDSKSYPCVHIGGKRNFIRSIILRYLDTPHESSNIRLTCDNRLCVNPYHFSYVEKKNEKLTGGDRRLLLAYLSQGASTKQIAKAFNVDPSTINRYLRHERLHARTSNHSQSR